MSNEPHSVTESDTDLAAQEALGSTEHIAVIRVTRAENGHEEIVRRSSAMNLRESCWLFSKQSILYL